MKTGNETMVFWQGVETKLRCIRFLAPRGKNAFVSSSFPTRFQTDPFVSKKHPYRPVYGNEASKTHEKFTAETCN
jgi:hypothetical protein